MSLLSLDPSAADPDKLAALGLLNRFRWVNKFGRNPDVSDTDEEAIWNGRDEYTGFPDTAGGVTLVSDNAADTVDGTGAQQVVVEGLDGDGLYQVSEPVDMAGTTPVAVPGTWLRANRGSVVRSGSAEGNIGLITGYQTGDVAAIFLAVAPGEAQTQVCAWTVPVDEVALLVGLYTTVSRPGPGGSSAARQVSMNVRARDVGTNTWRYIRPFGAGEGHPGNPPLEGGIRLEALTDLVLVSTGATVNNVDVAGTMNFLVYRPPV